MSHSSIHPQISAKGARAGSWFARGRQLGVGVLIAFTIKGICTTAVILTAMFAAMEDGDSDLFPHLLVWTVACIGGFCMLGGWRLGRNRTVQAPSHDSALTRND